jgi:hypothetical protein
LALMRLSYEVWSEVAEPGFGVGKQVEDDDRDGAGKGDEGFALAAAAGQAAVALAEERAGPGGGGGDLAEDALEVRVRPEDRKRRGKLRITNLSPGFPQSVHA